MDVGGFNSYSLFTSLTQHTTNAFKFCPLYFWIYQSLLKYENHIVTTHIIVLGLVSKLIHQCLLIYKSLFFGSTYFNEKLVYIYVLSFGVFVKDDGKKLSVNQDFGKRKVRRCLKKKKWSYLVTRVI